MGWAAVQPTWRSRSWANSRFRRWPSALAICTASITLSAIPLSSYTAAGSTYTLTDVSEFFVISCAFCRSLFSPARPCAGSDDDGALADGGAVHLALVVCIEGTAEGGAHEDVGHGA